MTAESAPMRLPCGADSDELLDQVAAGHAAHRNPHQAGCPHCEAALREYDRLWAPVRDVADTPVHAPESVLEAALRRIRGTAANPTYGLLDASQGLTRVAARVVVAIARESAQDVPGVRVVLGRLLTLGSDLSPAGTGADRSSPAAAAADSGGGDGPRVVAGVAGASTAIEVTLAADYGEDLQALGERIRAEVAAQIRSFTGLDPVSVTVHIDDVFD